MASLATWALVTDGTRALVLKDLVYHQVPKEPETVFKAKSIHLRSLFENSLIGSSDDLNHSLPDLADLEAALDGDFHQFAKSLSRWLEQQRKSQAFSRLAIFANPKMISALRRAHSPDIRKMISLEYPSDLIRLPRNELYKKIRDLISGVQA